MWGFFTGYLCWFHRSCGPDVALPVLPENGLSHRIRGLFESTVSKDTGSRCPLIWRMYLHFLVRLHINHSTAAPEASFKCAYFFQDEGNDISKCGWVATFTFIGIDMRQRYKSVVIFGWFSFYCCFIITKEWNFGFLLKGLSHPPAVDQE